MAEKICFIPARGGSKRVKGKNLANFKGKTLVARAIEQAKECNIFDHIIVSSDDERILSIAQTYEVEIHNRSELLSSDTAKIIDVIRKIIKTRPINLHDVIGVLLTTCPLRATGDIVGAYEVFTKAGGKKAVVSVKKNENPIQLSWKLVNGRLTPVFPEEYIISTRKVDHFDTFSSNDAIIFDLAENFMAPDRNLFGHNPVPYIMPWERSIAIDYEFQLKIVQCFSEMTECKGEKDI